MRPIAIVVASTILFVGASVAAADVRVTATPTSAIPGGAVLITVTGSKRAPAGEGGSARLRFFSARSGYQAVVAIPLDHAPGPFAVKVRGARPTVVTVRAHEFPEAELVVEDELANPDAAQRERLDADNHAIRTALAASTGEPRFTRRFVAAGRGKVTSTFGEWRTFNDGHRSQHLGLDFAAREGVAVRAANAGTVTLVRDCFLAGQVVVLDHGAGISTAYFHLQSIDVKEGDRVKLGERLGGAGQTGRTTGPHVHLSVWVAGGFVDPASFLRFNLRPSARGVSP